MWQFIFPCPYIKLHRKMHNQEHNVGHNKIYGKIKFPFYFGFVKQVENKVYILNWVLNLLVERLHWMDKHRLLYQKCNMIIVHFSFPFLLHFSLHYLL